MSKDPASLPDDIDRAILRQLQANARISNADVAREIGMAPSAVLERIRKLEARGVIQGYETRLDAEALGCGLLAYIFVRADERPGEARTGELLARVPGVLEVHHIAGEDCYLVKVRAHDTRALGRLLNEEIGALEAVRSTRTTIVLETLFETLSLDRALAATEVTSLA